MGVAFEHSGRDPFANQRQVFVAEPPFAGKIAVTMRGQPGRHVTRLRHIEDLLRATARVSAG